MSFAGRTDDNWGSTPSRLTWKATEAGTQAQIPARIPDRDLEVRSGALARLARLACKIRTDTGARGSPSQVWPITVHTNDE